MRIVGLSKSYGSIKALHDVSIEASDEGIVAIVGPNGSGKTTLLRLMAGLEKPDAGRIEIPQNVTMVFQRAVMFSTSVYKNLAYGLKLSGAGDDEIRKRTAEALRTVGLEGFGKRNAKKLSGGEQQRVAIARALLLEPKVLLLDEPTSNLDYENARIIEDIIRAQSGRLVMLATHNLFQVRRLASTVVFLKNGTLVEAGLTEELFENAQKEETRLFLSGKDYF